MIVIGIILLVIGVLAKIGIIWTAGFVVLILGLIAFLLGMTGHGIGGRRPWRLSSPRRTGKSSAAARSRWVPARRGSGRHRSCTR
jgi:energy-coupling factor transporter transmembrane protein EcfT